MLKRKVDKILEDVFSVQKRQGMEAKPGGIITAQ